MFFYKIATILFCITHVYFNCLHTNNIATNKSPISNIAEQIYRYGILVTYLTKLQITAVEFDTQQDNQCPTLCCMKCKDFSMTWGYLIGHLIGVSIESVSNQESFNEVKIIIDNFIGALNQSDLTIIGHNMLDCAQKLNIPCVDCNASSWEIAAKKRGIFDARNQLRQA